jgi:hypothetical protein
MGAILLQMVFRSVWNTVLSLYQVHVEREGCVRPSVRLYYHQHEQDEIKYGRESTYTKVQTNLILVLIAPI